MLVILSDVFLLCVYFCFCHFICLFCSYSCGLLFYDHGRPARWTVVSVAVVVVVVVNDEMDAGTTCLYVRISNLLLIKYFIHLM